MGDYPELDLHGYKAHEALAEFTQFYNRWIQKHPRKPFAVVHGYGASGSGGVIRKRLRALLEEYSDYMEIIPGERLGNPGMTVIYPTRRLPTVTNQLEGDILQFCMQPRSEEKIYGKFRRHGDPAVQTALKSLVRKKRLETTKKGRHKHYRSV